MKAVERSFPGADDTATLVVTGHALGSRSARVEAVLSCGW
jgi:hypothetical protein